MKCVFAFVRVALVLVFEEIYTSGCQIVWFSDTRDSAMELTEWSVVMQVSFMIMKNVLDTGQSVSMHRVYDLKGSAVNRRSVVWKQSGVAAQFDPGVTLKDMDLRQPLQLGAATSDVIRQLETDANFLSSLGIMDYSLLVCLCSVSMPCVVSA